MTLVRAEHTGFLHPVRVPVGVQRLYFVDNRTRDRNGRAIAGGDKASDVCDATGIDLQIVTCTDNQGVARLLVDVGFPVAFGPLPSYNTIAVRDRPQARQSQPRSRHSTFYLTKALRTCFANPNKSAYATAAK